MSLPDGCRREGRESSNTLCRMTVNDVMTVKLVNFSVALEHQMAE